MILHPLQQESRLPNTPNTFLIWHHFPTQIQSIWCMLRTIWSTQSIGFAYNTADTYDGLQQVRPDWIDHAHQHFHFHSYHCTLWSRLTDQIYRSINPFPIVLTLDHGQFIFYHIRLHFLLFIYILSHSSLFPIVPSHSESGSGSQRRREMKVEQWSLLELCSGIEIRRWIRMIRRIGWLLYRGVGPSRSV